MNDKICIRESIYRYDRGNIKVLSEKDNTTIVSNKQSIELTNRELYTLIEVLIKLSYNKTNE